MAQYYRRMTVEKRSDFFLYYCMRQEVVALFVMAHRRNVCEMLNEAMSHFKELERRTSGRHQVITLRFILRQTNPATVRRLHQRLQRIQNEIRGISREDRLLISFKIDVARVCYMRLRHLENIGVS